MRWFVCVAVILFTAALSSAHMGKYPCDYDKEFVSKIRQLSMDGGRLNHHIRAALDIVVDAATHCQDERLAETMKGFMEEEPVKTEETIYGFINSDMWRCSMDLMSENDSAFEWVCEGDFAVEPIFNPACTRFITPGAHSISFSCPARENPFGTQTR